MTPAPAPADEDQGSLSSPMSKVPMGQPMAVEDHPTYMLPPPTEGHSGTILGLSQTKPKKSRRKG